MYLCTECMSWHLFIMEVYLQRLMKVSFVSIKNFRNMPCICFQWLTLNRGEHRKMNMLCCNSPFDSIFCKQQPVLLLFIPNNLINNFNWQQFLQAVWMLTLSFCQLWLLYVQYATTCLGARDECCEIQDSSESNSNIKLWWRKGTVSSSNEIFLALHI